MKKQASTFILREEFSLERPLFRVLFAGLFASLALYGYCVGSSIFNVIAKKEAGLEIARLQTIVGGLEREYFALAESVSPERARSLGLSAVSHTQYVYQPGAVGSAAARQGL